MRNTTLRISDYEVIQDFKQTIQKKDCINDLAKAKPRMVAKPMKVVDMAAKVEEAIFTDEQDHCVPHWSARARRWLVLGKMKEHALGRRQQHEESPD